jgi:transcription elongation GreA/GreB family factor
MSRAFTNEQETGAPDALPERPISEYTNYVTPAGLRLLEQEAAALEEQRLALLAQGDDDLAQDQLAHIDRDLRYVEARLASAHLVDPAAQPRDQVAFGAAVTVLQQDGDRRTFAVVGEDEADSKNGTISYVSPLAQALTGARVGDSVIWKRLAGETTLTIESIDYPG